MWVERACSSQVWSMTHLFLFTPTIFCWRSSHGSICLDEECQTMKNLPNKNQWYIVCELTTPPGPFVDSVEDQDRVSINLLGLDWKSEPQHQRFDAFPKLNRRYCLTNTSFLKILITFAHVCTLKRYSRLRNVTTDCLVPHAWFIHLNIMTKK